MFNEIRLTDSSNVAQLFSSLHGLLQDSPTGFYDDAVGLTARSERSRVFYISTASTYLDFNATRTVCGAATFR